MKKLLSILLCVALLMISGIPTVCAIDIDFDTDHDFTGESPVTYTISDMAGKYKTQGRHWINNDVLWTDYTASGIEFNAACSGTVSVTFYATSYSYSGEEGGCYYTVIVDGVTQDRETCHITETGAVTVEIATGLAEGTHSFKIYRQTEIEYATIGIQSVTLTGELLAPPEEKELYLEFVGSSSTTGFGNLGTSAITDQTVAAKPIYQDGTQAYSYLTAQILDADYSIVASQGMGAKWGWRDPENMLSVYPKLRYNKDQTTEYDFSRTADIVVLGLGGNDVSYTAALNKDSDETNDVTDAELVASYVEMVNLIKDKNPAAEIVWVCNLTGTPTAPLVEQAIAQLGGAEKGYYAVTVTTNTEGAKGHSTAAACQVQAEETAEFIRNHILLESVTVTATGNGAAKASSPAVEAGETVTLTATPYTNSQFIGWYQDGDLKSTEPTYEITVNEAVSYTAKFTGNNLIGSMVNTDWRRWQLQWGHVADSSQTTGDSYLGGNSLNAASPRFQFTYLRVDLAANTTYQFQLYVSGYEGAKIEVEGLRVFKVKDAEGFSGDSSEYKPNDTQNSYYETYLKTVSITDWTAYPQKPFAFTTDTADTYVVGVKFKECTDANGATSGVYANFSDWSLTELPTTAHNNLAALRVAGQGTKVESDGLRIYNSISKEFVENNNIVEFGTLARRLEKLGDAELTFETLGAMQPGVSYQDSSPVSLWAETEDAYIYTAYLTNIKPENYGKDYVFRTYARDAEGNVYYGTELNLSVFDVAWSIDVGDSATGAEPTAIDRTAFDAFARAEDEYARYTDWLTKEGKTGGSISGIGGDTDENV